MQRIGLLLKAPDEEALKAALVDLYIAVGYRGIDLKTRFLRELAPYLSPPVQAFFRANLYKGLEATDAAIGDTPGSVLSQGFSGTRRLLLNGGRTGAGRVEENEK